MNGSLFGIARLQSLAHVVQTYTALVRRRTFGIEGILDQNVEPSFAALAAEGESTIHGAHHVKRGYENIERKFADLGARIARIEEGTASTSS